MCGYCCSHLPTCLCYSMNKDASLRQQKGSKRKTQAVNMAALPTCQDQLQSPKGRLAAAHSARNSLQSVQQVSIHHRYLQGPRRGPVSAWLAACFSCHAGCTTQDELEHTTAAALGRPEHCHAVGGHCPACLLHWKQNADDALQCCALLPLLKGHVQWQYRCPGRVLASSCLRGAALIYI